MANESTNGYSFIEKIKGIVEANLENEKFNLSSLARESGLSKITLYRKIKAATGKTTSQFIRDTKLGKASELLLNESLTVSEIAYKVGFGSATYFNKCFHKKFGCSPGEFRKAKRNKHSNLQPRTTPSKLLKIAFVIIPLLLIAGIFNMINEIPSKKNEDIPIIVRSSLYLGNPENEIYSIAANENIINELSSIEGISVFNQKIIEEYFTKKGNQIALYEKNPNAYLLTTLIHDENDFWIISWQLSSLINGKTLISRKDTTKKDQILTVGKHIAQNIALKFDISLSETTEHKVAKTNPTADYFYIQALKILNGTQIKKNPDLYNTAEQLLFKALNADSLFYKAYEELAFIQTNRSYWSNIHTETFLDSSFYYANKALTITDQSFKAHHTRASYFFHRNQIKKALNELDICTKLNPSYLYAYELKGRIYRYIDLAKCIENYHRAVQLSAGILPDMLRTLSFHYSEAGFFEESKYYAEKAFELDNDSMLWYMSLAAYQNANRKHKKGTEYLLKAYALSPRNSNLLLFLGKAYSDAGQYEQSVRYYNEYIDLLKQNNALDGLGVVHRPAYAYWQIGKNEEATYYFDLQIKNTLKDLDLKRPFHQFRVIDLAEVYAFNGEKEKAYEYLQFILDQPVCIPYWLYDIVKNDPQFDKLRNESQFKLLEKRYRDRYETEHEKVEVWITENHIKFN